MSATVAAVLVLEPGAVTGAVRSAHPGLFDGPEVEGSWSPRGLADVRLTLAESPMGFSLLSLSFSANELWREPGAAPWLDRLRRLGAEAGARFGCLCRYDYQREPRWIESEILAPLLLDEIDHLNALPVDVLIPAVAPTDGDARR